MPCGAEMVGGLKINWRNLDTVKAEQGKPALGAVFFKDSFIGRVVVAHTVGAAGCGLFHVGVELDGRDAARPAKAGIGKVFAAVYGHDPCLVAARAAMRGAVADAGQERLGGKAPLAQGTSEQRVLFKAIAAASLVQQLGLDGMQVKVGNLAKQRVEVFERDGPQVRRLQRRQPVERVRDGGGEAEAGEIGVGVQQGLRTG